MKQLVILILIAWPLPTYAGVCQPFSTCQPGDIVNVSSASLDKTKVTLSPVTLVPVKGGGGNVITSLREVTDPKTLSFTIPDLANEVPDGTYMIQIKQTPKPSEEKKAESAPAATVKPGEKQPEAAQQPAAVAIDDLTPSQIVVQRPVISAVSPPAAFMGDHGVNNLTILGTGFRKDSSTFHFTKRATPGRCGEATPIDLKKNCYDLKVDDEHQISVVFHKLDPSQDYFKGPMEFAINVDGLDTNTSSLALIDSRQATPMTAALIGLAVIVCIVYLLIRSGKDAIKKMFGKQTYLFNALFLDVQTSSYSLSKCQFYAWTAAAVVGYLFLAISKSYVQGSATFPDIPQGLPGILLASAGTAVLAAGITSAKGNKGAGTPEPNLSDFITSGGLVAADRLQFAVWTVIGIFTFLAIVFRSDPRNISDLPSIPTGFLEIMGISAAGYLGGKLARKPGPTLEAIAISGKPTKADSQKAGEQQVPKMLTFQLTGTGLSQSAMFSIDGAAIYPDTIQADEKDTTKLPKVVQQDPTIGDPGYARILHFTCTQPREEWFGGPHAFTITNLDKQKAELTFQIFKVDKIEVTEKKLTIAGACLDSKLKVEYGKKNQPLQLVDNPQSTNATTFTANVTALAKNDDVSVRIWDTEGVQVDYELKVA